MARHLTWKSEAPGAALAAPSMANSKPLQWWTSLQRSQPVLKSNEETHELLTEDDLSDHALLNLSHTPTRGRLAIPMRNVHIRIIWYTLLLGLVASLIVFLRRRETPVMAERPRRPWENFKRLDGYDQGIRRLVEVDEFVPENMNAAYGVLPVPPTATNVANAHFELLPYHPPLSSLSSPDYADLSPPRHCFLDIGNSIHTPSIYAFRGVPQHGVEPLFGSYDELGLQKDICFERYGRYGPYGLGYAADTGGSDLGMHGDQSETDRIWAGQRQIDWRSIDLGEAQRRCFQKNWERFAQTAQDTGHDHIGSLAEFPDKDYQQSRGNYGNRTIVPRTAMVLRAWGGLEYTPAVMMYIRSIVNELSMHTGGEYDVHLLVEVKDVHKPIWTSKRAYDEVLAEIVPEGLRSMATLWSQELMQLIYPGPFEPQFAYYGSMYPAMRSMHFALQWFMVQHPEYEYFWNWEMDLRYVGHFYELLDRTSTWAKKQRRDHLWERNARFYIPSLYENWEAFMRDTEQRSPESVDELGPDRDQTSSNDEADFISFEPIFDPANTLWNRRLDVTGYDTNLPIPQRRASIIVAARFSRHLLLIMHNETYIQRHSMASEMFPASMCLHHGLKAVSAPHPVYLERDWPAEFAEEIFNGGNEGQSGSFEDSVFGEGAKGNEHALVGTTFYYNSHLAGLLWRRWMGYREEGRGGAKQELRTGETGTGGRMCLRSTLMHPIKWDVGHPDR